MKSLATAAAALLALAPGARPAAADRTGVYFTESFGVGKARGELADTVGSAIHSRLGAGARWRFLAIEPWIGSALQWDREGALRGFIGGRPAGDRADLAYYGLDVKLVGPIHHGPSGERLEVYVRGGGRLVSATGSLDGYRGTGLGASAGFQLVGRVRALGFLWTPLFFTKRGPLVTGALFLDQGWERVALRRGEDRRAARIGHLSVGFGVGSAF